MRSREVVRVPSEVLEPGEAWAHPVGAGVQQPTVVYIDRRAEEWVEPVPGPSKTIPWLLIAIALAILLVACYAAWHTWVGPQLVPVRSHPVDLVGPSR